MIVTGNGAPPSVQLCRERECFCEMIFSVRRLLFPSFLIFLPLFFPSLSSPLLTTTTHSPSTFLSPSLLYLSSFSSFPFLFPCLVPLSLSLSLSSAISLPSLPSTLLSSLSFCYSLSLPSPAFPVLPLSLTLLFSLFLLSDCLSPSLTKQETPLKSLVSVLFST